MDYRDIEVVVMKLIGEVYPVGDTNIDAVRLENLKQLTSLTETLVTRIDHINYGNKSAHQASIKKASNHCERFLVKNLGIKNCDCEEIK